MQLTCCQKVRALTLRECNWTQQEVAADLGVNVRTIQRLEKDAARNKRLFDRFYYYFSIWHLRLVWIRVGPHATF